MARKLIKFLFILPAAYLAVVIYSQVAVGCSQIACISFSEILLSAFSFPGLWIVYVIYNELFIWGSESALVVFVVSLISYFLIGYLIDKLRSGNKNLWIVLMLVTVLALPIFLLFDFRSGEFYFEERDISSSDIPTELWGGYRCDISNEIDISADYWCEVSEGGDIVIKYDPIYEYFTGYRCGGEQPYKSQEDGSLWCYKLKSGRTIWKTYEEHLEYIEWRKTLDENLMSDREVQFLIDFQE